MQALHSFPFHLVVVFLQPFSSSQLVFIQIFFSSLAPALLLLFFSYCWSPFLSLLFIPSSHCPLAPLTYFLSQFSFTCPVPFFLSALSFHVLLFFIPSISYSFTFNLVPFLTLPSPFPPPLPLHLRSQHHKCTPFRSIPLLFSPRVPFSSCFLVLIPTFFSTELYLFFSYH